MKASCLYVRGEQRVGSKPKYETMTLISARPRNPAPVPKVAAPARAMQPDVATKNAKRLRERPHSARKLYAVRECMLKHDIG